MKTVIWVHSINETKDLTVLNTLSKNKTINFNFPIKLLTRSSQKEAYEKIIKHYQNFFENLELITEEDNVISDQGKVKQYEIQTSLKEGYEHIFQFDDDITSLKYKTKTGDPESVINDWLKEHLKLTKSDKSYIMSSLMKDISTSKPTKEHEKFTGSCVQCLLTNIKRLSNTNIKYESCTEVGHEDVDFNAQIIKEGMSFYRFNNFIYATEPLNTDTFKWNSLQERFTDQRNLFKLKWGNKYPWIKYVTSIINNVHLDDIKIDKDKIKTQK